MLSHVLVPMDDSDHASQALEYAIENHPEAEITVLHIVGVPSMLMGEAMGLAIQGDVTEAAADLAEPVFDRARELANERNREITTVVGLGNPVREILDRAEEYDAIVLGAHGENWSRATRQYLVGNVTDTVSKRAPVPVIIVR